MVMQRGRIDGSRRSPFLRSQSAHWPFCIKPQQQHRNTRSSCWGALPIRQLKEQPMICAFPSSVRYSEGRCFTGMGIQNFACCKPQRKIQEQSEDEIPFLQTRILPKTIQTGRCPPCRSVLFPSWPLGPPPVASKPIRNFFTRCRRILKWRSCWSNIWTRAMKAC